jgi:5-oxoprolinase (ATP-hydrolysing) subunit A
MPGAERRAVVKINLNADMGESFGAWTMGDDAALLQVVGAANIACGFHAGDPLVMRTTVRQALERRVDLGAHPSYPDLQGFGRRAMQMAPAELEAALIYQLGALAGLAAAEGGRLVHVKPHGALSNQACEDAALAETVVRAIRAFDRKLILLAPALSELSLAGRRAGLAVAEELFADRAYTETGSLVPRREPGAVLEDSVACMAHALAMLDAGGIVTRAGDVLPTPIHSICVHGDSPHAVATARSLRAALEAAGHSLVGLAEVLAG